VLKHRGDPILKREIGKAFAIAIRIIASGVAAFPIHIWEKLQPTALNSGGAGITSGSSIAILRMTSPRLPSGTSKRISFDEVAKARRFVEVAEVQ
jgi:hypothetical protein